MPSQRFLYRYLPFFILTLVFIAYLPCLKAGFVNWDDDVHFLQNFTLRAWPNLGEIWTTTVTYTYMPMTTTTWAIEHHFFGYNPFVFHLDNILLHLGVTAFVIIFSRWMGLSVVAAAFAALLFGIHPLHVESVAWATERKDVLYGFFYMAALLAYLRYIDSGRKKYFWLTIMLGVISICAKPMAVSLPLVLLVLDWYRRRKWTFWVITEKIFCGVFLIPIAFITYFISSHYVEPGTGQGPFIWVWCFMFYLYKFLYPWPLILYYGFPQSGNIFYLNVLVFACLLGALWVFRRNRLFVFAFAFYFASIFFLLRFHPFLDLVADRYMYLPSIGLCMFFAKVIERMFAMAQGTRAYLYSLRMALGLLIVVMAVMTWRQCEVWQSGLKLWRHQLKYDSRTATWLACCKLADASTASDDTIASNPRKFNGIRMLYIKAIQLKPDFPDPYLGLGNLFKSVGNWDSAERYYKLAALYDHKGFEESFQLGQIYQRKEISSQAIGYYRRAMAANPYLCADIHRAYDYSIQRHENADVYQKEESKMPVCP